MFDEQGIIKRVSPKTCHKVLCEADIHSHKDFQHKLRKINAKNMKFGREAQNQPNYRNIILCMPSDTSMYPSERECKQKRTSPPKAAYKPAYNNYNPPPRPAPQQPDDYYPTGFRTSSFNDYPHRPRYNNKYNSSRRRKKPAHQNAAPPRPPPPKPTTDNYPYYNKYYPPPPPPRPANFTRQPRYAQKKKSPLQQTYRRKLSPNTNPYNPRHNYSKKGFLNKVNHQPNRANRFYNPTPPKPKPKSPVYTQKKDYGHYLRNYHPYPAHHQRAAAPPAYKRPAPYQPQYDAASKRQKTRRR